VSVLVEIEIKIVNKQLAGGGKEVFGKGIHIMTAQDAFRSFLELSGKCSKPIRSRLAIVVRECEILTFCMHGAGVAPFGRTCMGLRDEFQVEAILEGSCNIP